MPDVLSKVNKSYLLLLVIFLISLTVRLWLLDKRWINPDEGAHLMDAVLVLDGKVPQVDFDSRQPFYTYTIAGFLKLFGINYISGRIMPLTFSILTGVLVFLISRRLFDHKVALLSASIYWMLPLELINSVVVKTEPLVVLLTCLSLYSLVRFSERSQRPWLIFAGSFAAMGFYVRESSLIIPLIVFGFMVFFHGVKIREILKSLSLFLAGYIGVFLLVLAYYSKYMSPGTLITSSLTPFGRLIWAVEKLPYLSQISLGSTGPTIVLPSQTSDMSRLYHEYIHEAFDLHSFLLIGLVLSAASFGRNLLSYKKQEKRDVRMIPYIILYLWVFFLFIAYGFYFFTRGFFIDYFREFLPPLIIVFSAWVRYSCLALEKEAVLERMILWGLCISAVLFSIQSHYKDIFGMGFHASLAIAIFTLLSFAGTFESLTRRFVFVSTILAIIAFIITSREEPLKYYLSGTVPSLGTIGIIYGVTWAYLDKKKRPSLKDSLRFITLSIVAAALAVGITYSAFLLDLTYDSVWSPQSVERTAAYLRTHTRNSDEVMSGAVIWELQALRRPFQMISHPLRFEYSASEEEREELRLAISTHPPKVIILDGYTEKTYIRQVPSIMELLQEKYELAAVMQPARYPIRVYQIKNESLQPQAFEGGLSPN